MKFAPGSCFPPPHRLSQGGFVISGLLSTVARVSEPSDELAKRLLSAFDLGPSWARGDAPAKKLPQTRDEEAPRERRERDDRGRRDERRDDRREPRGGGSGGRGEFRPQRGGGGGDRDRRQGGGRDFAPRELPQAAEGVRVGIVPAAEAVHLVVKEIHHLARVYSLYDVAQILLAGRERYHLRFELSDKAAPLFKSRRDDSLWLTKEEAISHFWNSALAAELYESEEVDTEPPSGNFLVVARCGMSGEWLGPPNFHSYQTTIRRIHREQFGHMSFEHYASRVRTERGEEAVNAWLDTMRKRVRWRLKPAAGEAVEIPAPAVAVAVVEEVVEEVVAAEVAPTDAGGEAAAEAPEEVATQAEVAVAVAAPVADETGWSFDRGEIERDFATRGFAEMFEQVRAVEVPGSIVARNLSPGLLACVRIATSHARKHAAILIPAICRLLENEHLSVFKREGKLFTGPARPHPLSTDALLAERPSAIVHWLEAHPGGKLSDLWKGVLPEGQTEPGNEWLADLFWLLTQGHVLLFADDSLILPRRRAPQGEGAKSGAGAAKPAVKAAKRKKRKKRRKSRRPKVSVASPAKMIRAISRMKPGALKTLRGPAMIWRRRLEKRGRIASLVEE